MSNARSLSSLISSNLNFFSSYSPCLILCSLKYFKQTSQERSESSVVMNLIREELTMWIICFFLASSLFKKVFLRSYIANTFMLHCFILRSMSWNLGF